MRREAHIRILLDSIAANIANYQALMDDYNPPYMLRPDTILTAILWDARTLRTVVEGKGSEEQS